MISSSCGVNDLPEKRTIVKREAACVKNFDEAHRKGIMANIAFLKERRGRRRSKRLIDC